MSHITTCELVIQDLDSLAIAAEKLGLELVRDKKTYKWFGQFVGDYNDPAVQALGIDPKQYGKCEHVLRAKDAKAGTYEIGLARNPKGSGFVLLYDFFAGGYGLMEKISSEGRHGQDANLLKQEYANQVSRRELARMGFRVSETRQNGKIVLNAVR